MASLERAHSSRRVGVWSLVGLLLVPLLIAGGFLLATWKSADRLDRVQAAVVNLDTPVKLNGQTVPLGRQLAGGLVNGNDDDQNFSWVLTDTSDAASGLGSGRYAAVVTIPKNFSAKATSYAKNDDTADQATLGVQTSQVSGLSDPAVGQAITAAATKALNTQLTKSYLDGIYVGFNTTQKQFTTVADAAGKLSDGTTSLAKGIGQTSDGTAQLADGLTQLDTGTAKLSTGVATYAKGVRTYADGIGTFADGVDSAADGAQKLAAGGKPLAAGAQKLADGADGLVGGLRFLRNGGEQSGVTVTGTKDYAADAVRLATQVGTVAGTLGATATASDADLAKTDLACPKALADADACAAYYAGVKTASGAAAQQLADPAKSAGTQARSAAILDAVVSATIGTKDKPGAQAYADGVQTFADGVQKYTKGTSSLAGGLDKLSDGADQLASGATKLASGGSTLASGTAKLADGVHASATGTEKLSTGLVKLADGGDQLADGTTKLADGLAKGAKQIPTYNQQTRQKLSEVVTTPVTTPKVTSVFSDVATTTLLAVLALWIGGLASFLVLRAVSGRVLASMKPSWRLSLEGLLPGAVIAVVQAAVLTVMLQALLKLDTAQLGQLAGFALLTALAFSAVNHALVAWFGGVGRFVSVLLVVLAAAGSITSAVPEVFDTISPTLPLTPALTGFRAIVTSSGDAGSSVGLLLAWLLVGVVAGILAVARRRVVAPLVVPVPMT